MDTSDTTQQKTKLIPVTKWNEHHQWPPVGGLRHLIFFAKSNGFDKVIRRCGRRVLIDEAAFFQWMEEQKCETLSTRHSIRWGITMSKIPMQQWYPDTHVADTANLTLEEQGAYRLVMDHMWIKGGCIRDDDKQVARFLRISVKRWQKIKKRLGDYLIISEGIITQKRLQKDYQEACEKSKKNAENGKIGGRKTAEKWKTTQANALANEGDSATAAPRLRGLARPLSEVMNQLELNPKP